ncbi:lipopolysaccharide assembly outer membrane protein LptD (OstA) [Deinobacterium chartae]|uniref:Lipopolysaccharide assembly outer membrane protein LptD (OstA) n=1 Tax=Deinobacterium chartae TaxID=521158 RepID=A0A841I0A5_9DEIO|nr:hypothetical protein [Deinobacterium chartae]MBB6098546.1 lipopolysaccharide assembly outer membrane protein LptD (OstA) [Deinobacterium chartae]
MKRFLMLSAALAATALAASFAGFSVKPTGEQKLDITTGVTVLPQGGTVQDAKNGVNVDAKWIEFKDGDYLKAKSASLRTEQGGSLSAAQVDYNAKSGLLNASGNLQYTDARLKNLTAKSVVMETQRQLAVASGGVRGTQPGLQADTVVVDYGNNRALLYGNYRWENGKTRLRGDKDNSALLVSFADPNNLKVSTKVPADVLKAYSAYLK